MVPLGCMNDAKSVYKTNRLNVPAAKLSMHRVYCFQTVLIRILHASLDLIRPVQSAASRHGPQLSLDNVNHKSC